MPVVFVNKPVMKPTEKDQVVQVGGPTPGPVLNVVNLQPFAVPTSDPLAPPPVTMGYQSSQPSGDGAGVSTHTDHLGTVGDHGFNHTVTGQSLCRLVGNQSSVSQLGDTSAFGGQRFQVGEHGHLRWRTSGLITGGGTNLDQPVGHPL